MTTFDRSECHLVDQVRRIGRAMGMRSNDWRRIAATRAAWIGQFIVWRCDDTMIVYSRTSDGKVRQRSHKPNTWRFSNG